MRGWSANTLLLLVLWTIANDVLQSFLFLSDYGVERITQHITTLCQRLLGNLRKQSERLNNLFNDVNFYFIFTTNRAINTSTRWCNITPTCPCVSIGCLTMGGDLYATRKWHNEHWWQAVFLNPDKVLWTSVPIWRPSGIPLSTRYHLVRSLWALINQFGGNV